jgi:hypothetical protein
MLGHRPLLQRRLRQSGQTATATIVEARRTHYTETIGSEAIVGNTRILWKLALQVEPDGEPAFAANVEALLPQLSEPSEGDRVPVRFDPDDPTKVILDTSEEARQRVAAEASLARSHERAERWRAAGQSDLADRYERIHDPALGLFGPLSSNREERRGQQAERRARIKEIMGAPATGGPMVVMPNAGVDVADELSKLAALRDRGVLTDAEFQGQKQKLLAT